MKTRDYSDTQCDLMVAEFETAIQGCDEALNAVYRLMDLTYDSEDTRAAQDALIRLRAKAEHAKAIWKSRKGSQAG